MSGAGPALALVYGNTAGAGGLGVQASAALAGLALGGFDVHAFGPGRTARWDPHGDAPALTWHDRDLRVPGWVRFTWLRRETGRLQHARDVAQGRWAAREVAALRPRGVFAFTQVALETLRWAREAGVPAVLESPNGHLRAFREVYVREAERWCGARHAGHPSPAMVERVEAEYALAGAVRVSSEWSRASLVAGGVPAHKVHVLQQPVALGRFTPPPARAPATGPLRVVFVGSLDLRKGFVYLLRAMRQVGPGRVHLRVVGATGDPLSRRLLERERAGLHVEVAPGDPLPALHAAELFVLPTLEDGSPFAVAEAMAAGLPVVVTDACGSAEWVRPGQSGWVARAGSVDSVAEALEAALARRDRLGEMGMLAREDTERRARAATCHEALARWVRAFLASERTA